MPNRDFIRGILRPPSGNEAVQKYLIAKDGVNGDFAGA